MKVRASLRALIVPILLLVALAACTPSATTPTARPSGPAASATPVPPRYGGRLTIGFVGELTDLNPGIAGNALAAAIFSPVVEGLFATNQEGRYEPWLAESVPAPGQGISDDGTVVIIRLRQGIAWEDGRAFTAEDLRFTRDVILNPANSFPPEVVAAHAAIRTLDVLDPFTVRLGYDRAAPATGDTQSFLRAFPIVYPARIFNGQTGLAAHPYARGPFGTGPFRFREWIPGDRLTIVRSGTYRDGGRPYLDEIVYRQFPDQPAAAVARQSGEIDLVLNATATGFDDPPPDYLRNITFFPGSPPTRTAHEWWRAE